MFSLSVELSSTLLPYALFSIGLPTLLIAQCLRSKTKKQPLRGSTPNSSNQKSVGPVVSDSKDANKKEDAANEKKDMEKSKNDGDEKKPGSKDDKDKDKTGAEPPKNVKSLDTKENTAQSAQGKKAEDEKDEPKPENNEDYQQVEFGAVPPPPK